MGSNRYYFRAYTGGLIGTALFAWLVYGFQLPQLDFANALVKVVFGYFPTDSSGLWYAGYYHMFVLGAMFLPWIYSRALYKVFSNSPILNGITLGIVLWALRELVMVPFAGLQPLYPGFSLGTKMVLASLLTHVAYGLSLCVVTGQFLAAPAPRPVKVTA